MSCIDDSMATTTRRPKYFNRINPERTKKRAIRQLEAMGYQVTLNHAS